MGDTYPADRLGKDGMTITSAIDHVYVSQSMRDNIKTRKLEESSTDHVTVVVELRWREKTRQKKKTHTKENKEKVNMRC